MSKLLCLWLSAVVLVPAQSWRCDWSVNGSAGADMAGAGYRCGATLGQTASGEISGSLYRAFIGYWQPEILTGIADENVGPEVGLLVTRLYAPVPNPCRGHAVLSYALAGENRVSLQIHDLTGRVVRTLVGRSQGPGRYSLRWDARDDEGRLLAGGVYFCRLVAGKYQAARKLVLQR